MIACGLLLASVLTGAQPVLDNVDEVIQSYYEAPVGYGGVEIPEKGDILWIEYDVTQDGREDILITGRNVKTSDWNWLVWDVYKGEASGGFRQLMFGMAFDPDLVFTAVDDVGVSHIATIRPIRMGEYVVTPLELENDKMIATDVLRTLSTDSDEDQAWLEEKRRDSQGLVWVIPAAELAKKYSSPTFATANTGDSSDEAPEPPAPDTHNIPTEPATTEATEAVEPGSSGSVPSPAASPAKAGIPKETAPAPEGTTKGVTIPLSVGLIMVLMVLAGLVVFWKRFK